MESGREEQRLGENEQEEEKKEQQEEDQEQRQELLDEVKGLIEGEAEQQLNEEDPYENDEQTYQEHFRKTFITENQKKIGDNEVQATKQLWSLHEMMIPAGKAAKLVRIKEVGNPDFRIAEVCDKLKFVKPTPVIILIGAMTQRAGKVLAGVARAALRTDAVIIDSGIGTGIEKFCLRKNVSLLGVCPEAEITYPKINPQSRKDNELTNGHSHFFLIGENQKYEWGQEKEIKFNLAHRIAEGRSSFGASKVKCKIVGIILGDNPYCYGEIELALNMGIPLILAEGSSFSSQVIQMKGEDDPNEEYEEKTDNATKAEVMKRLTKHKFFISKESSEDLASITKLLLTVTL